MESLPPKTQEQIKKTSTEALTVKLAKVGYDEEAIVKMSREQLIATWAELVATGQDKPRAAPIVYTNPEIERQRLQFEMQKWQEEKEERLRREQEEREERARIRQEEREEREAAAEAARIREEKARQEAAIATEAARKHEVGAAEARARSIELQHAELKLQQEQFEWQKAKDERDKSKQESVASQLKLFGDIIKNVAPKFPSDFADIPMFFESIEKVFTSVAVPKDLQAKLLVPHLGERAKSLLLRLDQTRQNDYEEVKKFLLSEFQLTPFQFKNRFEQAKRMGEETWTLFCARLKNLLEYYCRSRDVDRNFEHLFSLIVSDRIKSVLPQQCLNFILSAESSDPKLAYSCDKIATMVDVYFATHSYDGRPKVAGNGTQQRVLPKQIFGGGSKPTVDDRIELTQVKSDNTGMSAGKTSQQAATPVSTRVRCYACNQFGHTRKQCPTRLSQPKSETARKVLTSARVQAYACSDTIGTAQDATAGAPHDSGQAKLVGASVNQTMTNFSGSMDSERYAGYADDKTLMLNDADRRLVNESDHRAGGALLSAAGEKQSTEPGVHSIVDSKRNNRSSRGSRVFYSSNACNSGAKAAAKCSGVCHTSVIADERQSSQLIAEKIVPLQYIHISIDGISGTFAALQDSGSQVNLISRSLLSNDSLKSIGRISIRGAFGAPVQTDVVMLAIKPAAVGQHVVNIAPAYEILFAVCDELNEQVILTADTVNHLNFMQQYNVINIPEDSVVRSLVSAVDDNVGKNDDNDDDESDEDDDIMPLDGNSDSVISTSHNLVSSDSVVDELGDDHLSSSPPVEKVTSDENLRCADYITLRNEQLADSSLAKYWDFAHEEKAGFFIQDGLLYRHGRVNGEKVIQLCLPEQRISTVLKLAHDMPFGSHMAFRRTNDRVSMSFFFPGQRARVKDYCMRCETCQLFAPSRRSDLNVIEPIPRDAPPFGHLVFDCIGPFGDSGRFKYAFVITDLNTRFPMAYALTSITAKKICDCLIDFFSIFSMPTVVHCDLGTNFTSNLTQLLLKRLGCSPRFNSSYHPQASGLVERTNATLKAIISKLATSFPRSWETILPFALWSLRTAVNETLGISPYRAAFGRSPIGPLQILRESWIGKRELPLDLAKQPREYLKTVEENLRIGQEYADKHAVKAQQRYANYYNAKSSDKQFDVGEQVIYLSRNSSQKMFSHWIGPCRILRKKSPHSYVIDVNGVQRNVHVNHLRKFHPNVVDANVNTCAMIFDNDRDFGEIVALEVGPTSTSNSDITPITDVSKQDLHFDDANVVLNDKSEVDALPSHIIPKTELSHLTSAQQKELLDLLDSFAKCFSDKPGLCTYVEHRIQVSPDFKPKRLREYRIPELLKEEVQRQIDGLIKDGFIVPSSSPMASPLVCILKGRDGKAGVRLAIDYRYVNRYSLKDAYVMPNISDLIQKVGSANFITTADCRSGYWQLLVSPTDRWLTSFAYDGGFWEWTRLPFGLSTSGNSFVRCVQRILNPVRDFAFSFVDDLSVCSNTWDLHLRHLRAFLIEIRKSGLTLNLKKCSFAKPEVKFLGHVIGSGRHRPDEEKLATVSDLKRPVNKREVRRVLGFFSYFRAYIPNASDLTRVLSNLVAKDKPTKVVWTETEEHAFQQLKVALCDCTRRNLYTVQYGKPVGLHVDASKWASGACLVQWDEAGLEKPISFASSKFTDAQLHWAAIEKEAYAVIWALNKFRTWCFGVHVTVFSDSNPLTYITAGATKSAKLTRWALALQEFNITFQYRRGTQNIVPDFLSRPCGEAE